MNDITIKLYLYAMIYINYLQAKIRPAGANRKGLVIVNNILHRCNVPSRKKVEPALSCITYCLRSHPHITAPPRKRRCSNIHRINPRISGDPPQTILPYPVRTPTE